MNSNDDDLRLYLLSPNLDPLVEDWEQNELDAERRAWAQEMRDILRENE